jgi:hypothetical protein
MKLLTSVTTSPLQQGAGTTLEPPAPRVLLGPLQPEPLLLHLLQGVLQQQALQRHLLTSMPPPLQQAQSEAQHAPSEADGGTAAAPPAKCHHIPDAADVAALRSQPASPLISFIVQQQQQQQQQLLHAQKAPPAAPLQPLHIVSHDSSNDSNASGSMCTGAQPDAAPEVAATPVATLGNAASKPAMQRNFYDLLSADDLGDDSSSNVNPASFWMPSRGETAEMVAATDLLLSSGATRLCVPPSAGCAVGVPDGAIVSSC